MDPISIALLFLKKWWKEIALALVVVAGIWYVVHLQNTVETQKTTITQLTIANKTLTDSNTALKNTVVANNKTIAELGQSAAQTKEEFAKLSGRVDQQTHQLLAKLQNVMKTPVPTTCNDTIKYMIDAAPSYGTLKMSTEISQ